MTLELPGNILDTNFLFFFVFQAIQASLLIDLGQERSQDPSKKEGKIVGPSTELEQVPVVLGPQGDNLSPLPSHLNLSITCRHLAVALEIIESVFR